MFCSTLFFRVCVYQCAHVSVDKAVRKKWIAGRGNRLNSDTEGGELNTSRQERAAPLAHLGGELPTRAIGRGERGLR